MTETLQGIHKNTFERRTTKTESDVRVHNQRNIIHNANFEIFRSGFHGIIREEVEETDYMGKAS